MKSIFKLFLMSWQQYATIKYNFFNINFNDFGCIRRPKYLYTTRNVSIFIIIRPLNLLLIILHYIYSYTVTVRVSEEQPYQVREYVWCLNFPPRCSKYKIKFKTVYKEQKLVRTRPVDDCCKGYTKNTSEDRCIPVCSTDCVHGTCTAPDTCLCESGYGGPYCDICK